MIRTMSARFFSNAASLKNTATLALKEKIIDGVKVRIDDTFNVPPSVLEKTSAKLHLRPLHPLSILSRKISQYFTDPKLRSEADPIPQAFHIADNLHPVVSLRQNFDSLLVPQDHVSRLPNDTYYLNKGEVLRTHTSAHQHDLLRTGHHAFLVVADVYRRDEIDSCHYPVFHQVEGVRYFGAEQLNRLSASNFEITQFPSDTIQQPHQLLQKEVSLVSNHLRLTLSGLIKYLFNDPNLQVRWVDSYFPFTSPSWEMEILYRDKWMEVAGCGVIRDEILRNAGCEDGGVGWAFGLGLERIAMILFDIPDIRLFWSSDDRFHRQFVSDEIVKFKQISKYPAVYKDVSFWLPTVAGSVAFHNNAFCELVREEARDLVEDVQLIDSFVNPKTSRESKCYRIMYRSLERTLLNEEINEIQQTINAKLQKEMNLELR